MEEITDELAALEKRLALALSRLSDGVERISTRADAGDDMVQDPRSGSDQVAALQADLDVKAAELLSVTEAFETQLSRVSSELVDKDEKIVKQADEIAALQVALTQAQAQAQAQGPQGADDGAGGQNDLEKDNADLHAALSKLEGTRAQLKAANKSLRTNNKELRAALKDGLDDPSVLNAGLEASLAAWEAESAADRADADALRDVIKPLLEEARNA